MGGLLVEVAEVLAPVGVVGVLSFCTLAVISFISNITLTADGASTWDAFYYATHPNAGALPSYVTGEISVISGSWSEPVSNVNTAEVVSQDTSTQVTDTFVYDSCCGETAYTMSQTEASIGTAAISGYNYLSATSIGFSLYTPTISSISTSYSGALTVDNTLYVRGHTKNARESVREKDQRGNSRKLKEIRRSNKKFGGQRQQDREAIRRGEDPWGLIR